MPKADVRLALVLIGLTLQGIEINLDSIYIVNFDLTHHYTPEILFRWLLIAILVPN